METMCKKHAICITAHKNWEQQKDLIETVSSNSTDIFLHVDKIVEILLINTLIT